MDFLWLHILQWKDQKTMVKVHPYFAERIATLNFHFPNSTWIMITIYFHDFCYIINKKSFTMTVLHVMKSPNFMPLQKILSMEIIRLSTWHFVVSYMAGSERSRTETSTEIIWHILIVVRLCQLAKFHRT